MAGAEKKFSDLLAAALSALKDTDYLPVVQHGSPDTLSVVLLSVLRDAVSGPIINLKPTVDAAVNKLNVLTKSGGAAADASNIIGVAIPDGNGNTFRTRSGSVKGGTSQIIMADGANYWSKGSLSGEIKKAYLYTIYSAADAGIVYALGGYAGLQMVTTTTTSTDDLFLLLEDSATPYTRAATDRCVCVGVIPYEYNTANNPDHTIQATGANAPQVIWQPPDPFSKTKLYQTGIALDTTVDADWVDVYATNAAITFTPHRTALYEISFQFNLHAYSAINTACIWQEYFGIHNGTAVVEEAYYAFGLAAGSGGARGFMDTHFNMSTPALLSGGTSYTYKLQHRVIANTGIDGASLQKVLNNALRIIVKEIGR